MRQLVRRLIAVMAGLVGAMALAGCDVTGTITVRADDQVDLDLRVIVEDDSSCVWNLSGVRTAERRNRGGGRLCLLQGTVPAENLRRWGIDIAHNGEHLQAVYNPLGQAGVPIADRSGALTDVAVEVVFPGEVLDSTGITEGSTVRFTDVEQLNRPYGMRAVALDHPGPRLALLIPAITFAVGALGVAALWTGSRRRDLLQRSGLERFFAGALGSGDAGPDARAPEDAAGQGHPSTHGEKPGSQHAPGSLLPPELRQDAAGGASGWERPGTGPPMDGDSAASEPSEPEHAKWAPPHDSG